MATAIGEAVRRSRQALGLSTATLAQQASVSEQELLALEEGTQGMVASALLRLARTMGLAPNALLTDDSAMAANPAVDRAKFFHAAEAPLLSEADAVALAREVTRAQVFAELASPRVNLDDYEPTKPGGKPWRNGYDLATSLRSKLGLGSLPVESVQAILEDDLGILVAKHPFTDPRLRAAAVRAPRGRLIVVSRRLPTTLLRVSMAHELCHHLCDLPPNESLGEADDASLEGFSDTDRREEQRAKAFAVMFLAPSTLVRDLFEQPGHQFSTRDRALDAARALADRSGIGATAALWHLFHLEYLSEKEDDVQEWQRLAGYEPAPARFEPSFGDQDGLLRAIDAALAADEIELDQAERLRSL